MFELSNDILEVKVRAPWERYTASRFSQAAFIESVKFEGIEVCGQEDEIPREGISGAGMCAEFGIFTAIGYDECPMGELFLKPGVGLLKKYKEEYCFYEPFETIPEQIQVTQTADSIRFTGEELRAGEYAVQVIKEIRIKENTFSISYIVKNLGEKEIRTEEYVHNFICFDEHPIDETYRVYTGAQLEREAISEQFEVEEELMYPGKQIEEVHYMRTNPLPEVPYRWKIENHNVGIALSEETSFQPAAVAVWGKERVISVEAFKGICLKPGEQEEYVRTYRLERC